MTKRFLLLLVCIAMLLGMGLAGCGDDEAVVSTTAASAPATTAASAPATTAATAPATTAATTPDTTGGSPPEAAIELTVAYGDNKTEFSDAELLPWIQDVEQQSNGRLKISQVYYAGQLIESSELYDAAVRGTVDIAMNTASMNLNRWAIMDILSITPIDSQCERISKAYMEVFAEFHDLFDEEFSDSKLLAIFGTIPNPPGLPFAFVSKKPQSLADLKGLKICGPGDYNMDYLQALGMSPATIPPPEQYGALEKGIVDCTILDPIFYDMLNFGDVVKYQIGNIGLGGSPWFITMNSDKFNSLPPDLQDVLVEASAVFGDRRDDFGYDAKMEIINRAIAEKGLEVYDLPQEEIAKMKEVEATVVASKLGEYAPQRPEAQQIFDAWVAARAKYVK